MINFTPVLPLPPKRAAEVLGQQLVDYLSSGEFQPGGTFLSDHELMRLTGLSRNTVRKALETLRRAGWIEREFGRGTFIGPRVAIRVPARNSELRVGSAVRLAVAMYCARSHIDWYTNGVLGGMDHCASQHTISLELLGMSGDPHQLLRRMQVSRPNALVCLGGEIEQAYLIAQADRMGIPSVVVGLKLYDLDLPTVCQDDRQGIRLAVEYLAQRGHSRIGLISLTTPDLGVVRIRQGYFDALAQSGAVAEENGICWLSHEAEISEGTAAIAQYLDRWRPTAVVLGMGIVACRMAPLVQQGKLRIPRDLSVISNGNYPEVASCLGVNKATSTEPPLADIGRRAVEIALAIIHKESFTRVQLLPYKIQEGLTVLDSKEDSQRTPHANDA
jgi:DNA-binding LacI/PurR family transcriptional regulator